MNFDNKKLLIIGHVAKDVVETCSGRGSFWGGAGYQTTLGASIFLPKEKVILVSTVGKDFDFSILNKLDLDLSFIKVDKKNNTDIHWLDDRGEKRTYSFTGNLSQNIDLFELEKIKNQIAWIHLTSSPPEQQLEWLEQIKSIGLGSIPVSCDTFDTFARERVELVRKVMNNCNLSFVNKNEYEAIDGKSLNTEMILKLGPEGAEYRVDKQSVIKVKTNKTLVKDTTGAGDMVAGVFLALLIKGVNKESALKEACRVATMSVEEFGTEHLIGRSGLGDDFAVETDRD